MVVYTPGIWTPEGWFPTSFPVERALVGFGLYSFGNATTAAMVGGMLATGVAFGLLLLLAWMWIASRYRSMQMPHR